MNLCQNSFELSLGLVKENNELVFLNNEFEMIYNDGISFGVEDYKMFVPEHPTEDLFNLFRSEALDTLFFNWILEGVWNSKLMNLSLPLIYSTIGDCDNLYDLKNGYYTHDNFDFWNE